MVLLTLGIAGLFLVPFMVPFHTAPLPSFYSEWWAAPFGLLIVSALLTRRRQIEVAVPHAVIFPAVLIVLLETQFLLGYSAENQGFTELAIQYLSFAIVLIVVVRTLIADLGFARMVMLICWVAVAAGVISALIAVAQHAGVEMYFPQLIIRKLTSQAHANIAQSNHLASLLALSLAGLGALYVNRYLGKLPVLVMLLILLTGLALSGSRSAWIYILLFFILATWYRVRSKSVAGSKLVGYTLGAAILFASLQQVVILLPLGSTGAQAVGNEVVTATARLSSSSLDPFNLRYTLWSNAWKMFTENPLFGVGYRQYSWHFFQIEASSVKPIYWLGENHAWSNCHNTPLQLLAEFGVVAAMLLLLLSYWLYKSCRYLDSPERWASLAMLLVIMAHSMVEYPLYYLYFLLPVSILMALVFDGQWSLRLTSFGLAAIVLVICGSGALIAIQMLNDYRTLEAIHANPSSRYGVLTNEQLAQLARIQQGSQLSPQADALLNKIAVSTERPASWPALLSISSRVMKHDTAGPSVYRHIFLLTLNGRLVEADYLLGQARHVYPGSFKAFGGQIAAISAENPENQNLRHLLSQVQSF